MELREIYILGSKLKIETGHKLLVPLLSRKHLNNLPPRALWFILKMAEFDYTIAHVPEKLLTQYLPRPVPNKGPYQLEKEVDTCVNSITKMSLLAME